MTIVVANRMCMAAERLFTIADIRFHAPKLWRHKGAIYSSTGDQGDWLRFQRWVLGKDHEIPEIEDKEGFNVLKLDRRGIWYIDYRCYGTLLDDEFFAIGVGDLAAICLMDKPVNMTPVDAIRQVCKHAEGVGGAVDVMFL